MLTVSPKRIFIEWNSALSDSSVVKAPGPATRGNTSGTRVASFIGPLFLKISMSSIISRATQKMMIPPAAAKDVMSTWNNLSNKSPARKNTSINENDSMVALNSLTGRSLCFRLMIIGTEPIMSIIANKTMNALKNSCKLKFSNIVYVIFLQK